MDTGRYPQMLLGKLARPAMILVIAALGLVLWLPIPASERWEIWLLLLFAGATLWIELSIAVPRSWPASWGIHAKIVYDLFVISLFELRLPFIDFAPFYGMVVIITAVIGDRRSALIAAALASGLDVVFTFGLHLHPPDGFRILIHAIGYFVSAMIVSDLTHAMGARWSAAAAESEQRRVEIERRRDELEGLFGISQAFGNLEDTREMFRQVTERIARLLGSEICILTRIDDVGRMVRGVPPGYGVSDEFLDAFEYQSDDNLRAIWDVFQSEYLLLNKPADMPPALAERLARLQVRQLLAARMMRGGRPIGLIFVANTVERRDYDDKDGRLLCILAGQAAITVENARLYGNTRDNLQDVTRLFAVSAELSADADVETIPRRVVHAVAAALNSPMASIALVNEATGQLEYVAAPGIPSEVTQHGFRENGLAMTVLKTGTPRFIEDLDVAELVNPVTRAWGFRSVACLPIHNAGKRMGVLYVNYTVRHSFTDIEKNMLVIFANQTAIALENGRLRRITHRKAVDAATLATLSRSLAETMDLDDMFRVVERQVREGMPCADAGALWVYEATRRVLQIRSVFGYDREILNGLALELGEEVPGQVFRTGCSMLIDNEQEIRNLRQRTMRSENQALLGAAAYGPVYPRSVIGVPVSSGGERIGVITLENSLSASPFGTDELRLAEAMADRVGLAIRNAQLYTRGMRRATQLAAVAEVTRRVAAILDLDELLPTVTLLIHTQFGFRYVHLFIIDANAKAAVYRAGAGPAAQALAAERKTIPMGNGIVGKVAENGIAYLTNDVNREPGYAPNQRAHDVQSEIALPLQVGKRLIGVLDVQSERSDAFETSDVATLKTLAGQIAIAIVNAELYGEMQEQAHRDSLTQAFNHGHFLVRLDGAVEQARQGNRSISLIMLDIDLFKAYNDRYGHVIGDTVLTQVVQTIRLHVHESDLVGRWGGEEFGVGLLDTDIEGARTVAFRIQETLAQTRIAAKNGETIGLPTVSQGLACYPRHAHDVATLIDLADAALYRAKAQGRNQILSTGEP